MLRKAQHPACSTTDDEDNASKIGITTIILIPDGAGGADLILADAGVPTADRAEVIAGWVSVLLALKAAVDFGVDLRNHDPSRTWEQGYTEN